MAGLLDLLTGGNNPDSLLGKLQQANALAQSGSPIHTYDFDPAGLIGAGRARSSAQGAAPMGKTIKAFHSAYEPFDAFDFSRLGKTTLPNVRGSGVEDWAMNLAKVGAWASDVPVSAKMAAPVTLPVEIGGKGKSFGSLDKLEASVRRAGGPEQFRRKMLDTGYGHVKVKDEEFGSNSFIGLAPEFFTIRR